MSFLALTNATVFTGEPSGEVSTGTLLIHNERIHGVYDSLARVENAAGSPVQQIDVTGMTVLPGLIDCHVHLFFSGTTDSVTNRNFELSVAAQRAAKHLEAGVTTVRDLGAPIPEIFKLRDEIKAGCTRGSRIMACGRVITTPNGHGCFVGTEVRSSPEVVQAVKQAAEHGVDCIKLMVSGGVSTPNSDLTDVQFSEENIRSAVEAAHDLGLKVAAHASNPESIRISAVAGVDSIEHGVLINETALDALTCGSSVLVPTLSATRFPPGLLDDLTVPDFVREKAKITLPAHRESVAQAIAASVPIAGGTDAGSTMTAHGLAAIEARELVKCGLSTREAIAALTRNAAALLGLGDQLGTLERGKLADVIVVGGNPLDDIAHLQDVRLVIQEGKVVHQVT